MSGAGGWWLVLVLVAAGAGGGMQVLLHYWPRRSAVGAAAGLSFTRWLVLRPTNFPLTNQSRLVGRQFSESAGGAGGATGHIARL